MGFTYHAALIGSVTVLSSLVSASRLDCIERWRDSDRLPVDTTLPRLYCSIQTAGRFRKIHPRCIVSLNFTCQRLVDTI